MIQMGATDIDPRVFAVVCDVYDKVTRPYAAHPGYAVMHSPEAGAFAFELLMMLADLGYKVTDAPSSDWQ